MSPEEIGALEDRVCLDYTRHRCASAAHDRATAGRTPYRCPFGNHWHVEALTMDELGEVARMLRDRRDPAASPLVVGQQAR